MRLQIGFSVHDHNDPMGKLKGRSPNLSTRQQLELRCMYETGDYSVSDLAELFCISRLTVYKTLERQSATEFSTSEGGS